MLLYSALQMYYSKVYAAVHAHNYKNILCFYICLSATMCNVFNQNYIFLMLKYNNFIIHYFLHLLF